MSTDGHQVEQHENTYHAVLRTQAQRNKYKKMGEKSQKKSQDVIFPNVYFSSPFSIGTFVSKKILMVFST